MYVSLRNGIIRINVYLIISLSQSTAGHRPLPLHATLIDFRPLYVDGN